jgi:hypothetical protein
MTCVKQQHERAQHKMDNSQWIYSGDGVDELQQQVMTTERRIMSE